MNLAMICNNLIKASLLIIGGALTINLVGAPSTTLVLDQFAVVYYLDEMPDLGSKEDVYTYAKIITQQNIAQREFDGREHSLDQILDEKLLCKKAEALKMAPSDEDFDRQLEKMNMTPEQQVHIAKENNFIDVYDFKQAFKEMYVANMSLGFEIESRLVITDDEIRAYYDKNPVWLEAEYEILTSFVPFHSHAEQQKIQAKLAKLVETGAGYKVIWEDPIIVKISELSPENNFLTSLKEGQIYFKALNNGFDIFKMSQIRERRLQPLLERKTQIVSQLRSERYAGVAERVRQDLRDKAVIYYPAQY